MGGRRKFSASLGGPSVTVNMKGQKRRSLIYSPRHAVAASTSQASIDGVGTSAASRTRPLSAHQEDLRTLVMRLSTQVEQLSQVVAARESNKDTEGD
jgi:hypothetical protein